MKTLLPSDVWTRASWDEYLKTLEDLLLNKGKSYYNKGHMRLEMSPVGHDHAADNSMVDFAVQLFCTLRGIPFKGLANCSYRKAGERESQPDLSYYVGEQAQVIPWGTTVVDLNRYPPPNLAIEIAVSSLLDDQGNKRSLYEDLGVAEYWVVDVQLARILAYTIANRGSKRIDHSQVLTGLSIAVLEEAMQRSRQQERSQVGAWLLAQFQP
ncbi:Uma2 family endonuclease [Roseofilum reptotaenium]|nr:Uma2 family endonuclease [Roseofilum reptotaenium]